MLHFGPRLCTTGRSASGEPVANAQGHTSDANASTKFHLNALRVRLHIVLPFIISSINDFYHLLAQINYQAIVRFARSLTLFVLHSRNAPENRFAFGFVSMNHQSPCKNSITHSCSIGAGRERETEAPTAAHKAAIRSCAATHPLTFCNHKSNEKSTMAF